MTIISHLLVGVLMVCNLSGCAREQPIRARQMGHPLIDVNKGGGSLPMRGVQFPANAADLKTALVSAYEGRLLLADPEKTVRIDGRDLSHLRSLTMDISNARVRKGYRPTQFEGHLTLGRVLQVDRLAYTASPLVFDTAAIHMRLEAYDAPMQMMRDKTGESALVMLGAREGFIELAIGSEDLRKSFIEAARRGAAAAGATLQSAELTLHSPTPHSMDVAAHIRSRWMLLPVTFHVRGLMEVDASFRVTFSHLRCEGENPLGVLVASFVESRMKKAEERIYPLMRFGDGRTHMRSFNLSTDDGVYLQMGFGH